VAVAVAVAVAFGMAWLTMTMTMTTTVTRSDESLGPAPCDRGEWTAWSACAAKDLAQRKGAPCTR
jgi:hypothetical protein